MKYLQAVLVATVSIFAPIQAILVTTSVMILGDFITGVLAARKRGEEITSAGFRRSISKLLVYEVALMMGFLAERYMIDFIPVTKMISSLVALTEIKSIYENLDSIQGGKLLESIITKLGSDNAKIPKP